MASRRIIGFYTDSKGRKKPILEGRRTGTLYDYMPGIWRAPILAEDSRHTYKPLKKRGLKCDFCGSEAIATAKVRRSVIHVCRRCLQDWYDSYREYMTPREREYYVKTFGLRG